MLIVCKAGGEPQLKLYELIGDPDERHDLLAAEALAPVRPALLAGPRSRLDFVYRDLPDR